jgi:hypothetical protein
MTKKILLVLLVLLIVAGSAFGQVRFWWWGRAQITPYERSWDPANFEDGNQDTGYMNAYIWWSRFGIEGNHGGTVGFTAETATMLVDTGVTGSDSASNSFLGSYWANWDDFWSYSLWYKPLNWLQLRVGKYSYLNEGSAWVMEFFDRTRYSVVGLGDDEFFTGYSNIVQLVPGTVSSGTSIPAGFLAEGFFNNITVSLNFKSMDPQMSPLDYLQTIQIGARYDVPGLGFFRAQAIGFDPEGEIVGNYLRVNQATCQIQLAANITGFPGMEFRLGFQYFFSKANTNFVDGLRSAYNFNVDKNSFAIPFGFEVTMFNPLSFRVVGNFQYGKDTAFGQDIWHLKTSGQVKYALLPNLTALVNVSAYNIGKHVFHRDGADILGNRDPAIDTGIGIQMTGIRGANIQTGIVIQYHTAENTQLGIAIPFTFDFGF